MFAVCLPNPLITTSVTLCPLSASHPTDYPLAEASLSRTRGILELLQKRVPVLYEVHGTVPTSGSRTKTVSTVNNFTDNTNAYKEVVEMVSKHSHPIFFVDLAARDDAGSDDDGCALRCVGAMSGGLERRLASALGNTA